MTFDVRCWHKADSLSGLAARPLLGAKQTFPATTQMMPILWVEALMSHELPLAGPEQMATLRPQNKNGIFRLESAALALGALAAVACPSKLWDRLFPSRGWFSDRSHSIEILARTGHYARIA